MNGEERKRPRFFKLRIAFSAVCGMYCVLVILLWVRSYWHTDAIDLGASLGVVSENGRLMVVDFVRAKTRWDFYRVDRGLIDLMELDHQFLGFGYTSASAWRTLAPMAWSTIIAPYWSAAIFMTTMAIAPWVRYRFSLRTLLIGITLIAFGLGIIAAFQ